MDVNCFIKRVLDPNVRTEGVQNSSSKSCFLKHERSSIKSPVFRGDPCSTIQFGSKSKKKRVGEEVGLEEVTIRNRDENYPRMKEAEAGEERNE